MGDPPRVSAAQYNCMDDFGMDSDPADIVKRVSQYLGSVLPKFPYGASDSLHDIPPLSTGSGSSVEPLWISPIPLTLSSQDPWVSLFDNPAEPEQKDTVWNIDSTVLPNVSGKALTAADVVYKFQHLLDEGASPTR